MEQFNRSKDTENKDDKKEKFKEAAKVKIVQRRDAKWNLQHKETGEFISIEWFDNLGIHEPYTDAPSFVGVFFLEPPVEAKGWYPYTAPVKCVSYTGDGTFIETSTGLRGIYGFGEILPKYYDEAIKME